MSSMWQKAVKENPMTKADFDIIRNSITMRQLAEFYGFRIDSKGFIRCQFHGNGTERTPSLKVFEGYRGFHCKACGTGGDVTRFVELYENLSSKDAVKVLSERFNIPITDNGTIPPEAIQRAKQAQYEREQEKLRQQQLQAELRRLGTLIYGYERVALTVDVFGDVWCYCVNELPLMRWKWEELFQQLRK